MKGKLVSAIVFIATLVYILMWVWPPLWWQVPVAIFLAGTSAGIVRGCMNARLSDLFQSSDKNDDKS